jgi:acyl-homoserine lactone acylase PvdQ
VLDLFLPVSALGQLSSVRGISLILSDAIERCLRVWITCFCHTLQAIPPAIRKLRNKP